MTKRVFPKTLYVKIEADNEENEYFVVDGDMDGLVDQVGPVVKIGTYQLVEVCKAEARVQTTKIK